MATVRALAPVAEAEPLTGPDYEASQERRGCDATAVWMFTMGFLWLFGYWTFVWKHAPRVGTAMSLGQEWRGVRSLPQLFMAELQRLSHLSVFSLFLGIAALGACALLAWLNGGSKAMKRFKHSAPGVFVLHRLLPLVDIGSDLLITFCKADVAVCSNDGLWSTDYWWARLSLFLIASSFVATWILSAPVFRLLMQRKGVPLPLAVWSVFGLPCSALLGFLCALLYPCKDPDRGWLAKMLRLQKVVEVLLESPAQALLQLWMLVTRVAMAHQEGHKHHRVPLTLAASLLMSLVNIGAMVEDTRATAKAQKVGFFEALWEELLVGLNKKAPLLPVMRFMTHVSWAGEGVLKDEHCQQIAQQLFHSPNVQVLDFAAENRLSALGAGHLAKAALQLYVKDKREVQLRGIEILRLSLDGQGITGLEAQQKGVECLAVVVEKSTSSKSWIGLSRFRDAKCLVIVGSMAKEDSEAHCNQIAGYIGECRGFQHLVLGIELDWHVAQVLGKAAARNGFEISGVERLSMAYHGSAGPEGCRALVAGFPSLQHLVIDGNNAVGKEGCQVLASGLPSLQSLEIWSYGNNVTQEDLKAFRCEVKFLDY